jgi:TRAP-type C4-dicarboxylate transport system permease small subunit
MVLLAIGVFARYFARMSLTYVHEITLLSAVWVAFLGAAEGIRNHYHVRIDVLTSKLPKLGQIIVEIVVTTVLTVAVGALTYMGYRVLIESSSILEGLNISRKPLIAAMPVGFTFMTYFMVKNVYELVKGLRAHSYDLPIYEPEVVEGDEDEEEAFARLYVDPDNADPEKKEMES